MGALIGKKLGMTQMYDEKEDLIPVTIVAAGPCPVVAIRTEDDNGYAALQLAFDEIPEHMLNKPERGHLAKAAVAPHRILREFRGEEGEFAVGQVLDVG
ncbi:MAG: 50S ribosomal protein L3, partial [Candidatus Latescibacteria bacterium]|nr:50S ribosomal protein L3 [Candidatus Latescibacterota bacterium]